MAKLIIDLENTTDGVPDEEKEALKKLTISSIQVTRQVNRISQAIITFIDPDDLFKTSNLQLGYKLELSVKKEKAELLFVGGIVKIDTRITDESITIDVLVKSPLNSLTQRIDHRSFPFRDDQDNDSKTILPLLQNQSSDWDFLVCLADMHQAWVIEQSDQELANPLSLFFQNKNGSTTDYEISTFLDSYNVDISKGAKNPELKDIKEQARAAGTPVTQPDITFDANGTGYNYLLGIPSASEILEINNSEAAGGRYGKINYFDGDGKQQPHDIQHGYIGKAVKGKALSVATPWTNHFPDHFSQPSQTLNLKLAKARDWKIRQSLIMGKMRLLNTDLYDPGHATPQDDKGVHIFLGRKMFVGHGLADTLGFEKNYKSVTALLTKITHNITVDGWETTLSWGASPKFHIEEFPDIQRPPTISMLPTMQGIHIAEVTHSSFEFEGLVKAKLFNDNAKYTFRKLHNTSGREKRDPNAKKEQEELINRRWLWPKFMPGDLLVVSFTAGDPANPVALGSLDSPLFKHS